MEDLAESIEAAYAACTHVRQALVVVGTDAENAELAEALRAHGHDVGCVTYAAATAAESEEGADDEACLLPMAQRVVVMTYAAWWLLAGTEGMDAQARDHNLLVLDPDLDAPAQDRVLGWVAGCRRRGFWRAGPYRWAIGTYRSEDIMLA